MDRYCLTWSVGDQRIMRGWWSDLPTAERKFKGWIVERGGVVGARITLTDEADDGRLLKSWPDD